MRTSSGTCTISRPTHGCWPSTLSHISQTRAEGRICDVDSLTVRRSAPAILQASRTMRRDSSTSARPCSYTKEPAGVSETPRFVRRRSTTPSSRSSRLICLITACDERYSSSAALAKLPRSATSKKTSKCLSCIAASPQFARHTMAGIVTPAARMRRRHRSCTVCRGPLALGGAGAGVSGEASMIQERACCHPDRQDAQTLLPD